MTSIEVCGPHPYQVILGSGLCSQIANRVAGSHHVVLITQPSVRSVAEKLESELAALDTAVTITDIPDAEYGKTYQVLERCWDVMGDCGMNRDDVVIGLGGGAATDVAGFVAASWMRGIRVIHVPTSLLAMVDAAVGGKTGINTPAGKNLVGAFHEPDAVFIDFERIASLPPTELVSGSAEIIKTGFIADEKILRIYEDDPVGAMDIHQALPELIERSVRVKASVVSQDLKESGLREILNYGHTFGHAVEQRENYRWRHGNAVAVGMMFAAYLAQGRGLIDAELVERHRRILSSAGLPTSYEPGHFLELKDVMMHDKKNRDGKLRFVLLNGVESVTRVVGPDDDELQAAYQMISSES